MASFKRKGDKIMKQLVKVIHVELNEPYRGGKHYYFGSKTAIYDHLPENIIGIKKGSLWNVDLEKGEYKNRHCIIRLGVLRRKETSRGNKISASLEEPAEDRINKKRLLQGNWEYDDNVMTSVLANEMPLEPLNDQIKYKNTGK